MHKKHPILIGSTNQGKIKEISHALSFYNEKLDLQILTLHDFPHLLDVEETGDTFYANAYLKAHYYYEQTQMPVLADDSGLSVNALNGEPGVYSARYAGIPVDPLKNIQLLFSNMQNKEDRVASFVTCFIFYTSPDFYTVSYGHCKGEIALSLKGENGFGYDPIFFLPEYGKHMAELSLSEKQLMSHRGKAIKQIMPAVCSFFENYEK